MYAFGLVETGFYKEAEKYALKVGLQQGGQMQFLCTLLLKKCNSVCAQEFHKANMA